METVWIVLAVLVVIAALLRAFAKKRQSRADPLNERWPLESKRHLLTERERVLFQRLRDALPDHVVLAQVQLIHLLIFERGKWTQALFNRVCQLSVDFVVLRPDTSIVAAIELDDASHDRDNRRKADARKTHALHSAGIHLVRWNAKTLPDLPTIVAALAPRP
jgi:hypothetical protein